MRGADRRGRPAGWRALSNIALALLVLAGSASALAADDAVHDRAGNRLEPLLEQTDTAASASADPDAAHTSSRYCTADGQWCVRTLRGEEDTDTLEVAHQVDGEATPRYRFIPLPAEAGADSSVQPWPFIVRMPPGVGVPVPHDPAQAALENVLVGALRAWTTGYSGGGAGASTLALSRIEHQDDGIQIDALLTLPGDGYSLIRACFGEEDFAHRAGACHDEYTFTATLTLDPAGQGAPVLLYRTTATRYPAGVSRQRDSLAQRPLKKKDLRTETDRACTFQRRLQLQGGQYKPDTPLPDCAEFTEL